MAGALPANDPAPFGITTAITKGIAYEYLQIVRSYREGGKVKQQIIGSLGRRDKLVVTLLGPMPEPEPEPDGRSA